MKNSNVVIPTGYVLIPMERYDELLDTESRVDLLVEQARRNQFFDRQDVFMTLGYLQDWDRMEQEKKEREEAWKISVAEIKESNFFGNTEGDNANEDNGKEDAAGKL